MNYVLWRKVLNVVELFIFWIKCCTRVHDTATPYFIYSDLQLFTVIITMIIVRYCGFPKTHIWKFIQGLIQKWLFWWLRYELDFVTHDLKMNIWHWSDRLHDINHISLMQMTFGLRNTFFVTNTRCFHLFEWHFAIWNRLRPQKLVTLWQ